MTPVKPIRSLLPWLPWDFTYCEPCAGTLRMAKVLGMPKEAYDIKIRTPLVRKLDALELEEKHVQGCDFIITNPPWTREILHPLIERFAQLRPTWLLFDADWAYTKQANPYLRYCSTIVAVGRVSWMENGTSGLDNAAWYRFDDAATATRFHGIAA